jgi:hypothetical protein
MTDVAELLERAVPPYAGPAGDWTAVLRDAGVTRRRRRARLRLALAPVAVAIALAVAWPFAGGSPSVVERALAAAGSGQVLHVVFETSMPKTFVDLETGERREVRGRHEVWFDPARGASERETFGGVVQWETVIGASDMHPHHREIHSSLGEGYRDALRSGSAEVVEDGVVDGVPVHWIRIAPAHEVAVSRETYAPVHFRIRGDGPALETRILEYETVAAAPPSAGLGTSRPGPAAPPAVAPAPTTPDRGRAITLREAARVLGRPPVWVGDRFDGLRLTAVRSVDLAVAGDVRGVSLVYESLAGGHVEITAAPRLADGMTMLVGLRGYAPPTGTLVLAGSTGLLRSHGLFVTVHAADETTAIAVARALRRP